MLINPLRVISVLVQTEQGWFGQLEVDQAAVNGDSKVHGAEWMEWKLLDFMSRF